MKDVVDSYAAVVFSGLNMDPAGFLLNLFVLKLRCE